MKQEIGTLRYIYLDEIKLIKPIETHDFLITSVAKAINQANGRNWIPLIVKQIASEEYQVIANSLIFAGAQEAGINKVWCIIADDSAVTEESAQILAQEKIAKINLATATRDDIKSALDYLIKHPIHPLVGVKLATATERIDNAPREYWKESLIDVTQLRCGITKGKKLNIFKEVFYVTPEPLPDVIKDKSLLNNFTVTELKKMAKKRGFSAYSKLKKTQLIDLLSKDKA